METYMNNQAVNTTDDNTAAAVATPSTEQTEKPKPNLTEREKEVLRLVCDGRIFRKIGVGNRTQAAVLLVKQRWI